MKSVRILLDCNNRRLLLDCNKREIRSIKSFDQKEKQTACSWLRRFKYAVGKYKVEYQKISSNVYVLFILINSFLLSN